MAPQQSAKFKTAFFGQFRTSFRTDSIANYASIWTLFATSVTRADVLCNALNISQIRRLLVVPQDSQNSVEILQNLNNRTQSLREISWLLLTVINSRLGRLTLNPAGIHCPAWDDAFVSSYRRCREADFENF